MLAYWVIFTIPAWATLFERKAHRDFRSSNSALGLACTVTAILIGWRFEVGGDWFNYLLQFETARGRDFWSSVQASDPGYVLLNWLCAYLGGSILHVNIVCGSIFSIGLFKFVKSQPRPWLALTVAAPYLIIVVAMGYTRQGVAIGLAMWDSYNWGKEDLE